MHGTSHPDGARQTAAKRRQSPADSPRMFDNDLLDALSRVPWWVVPLIYVPGVVALLAWGLTAGMSAFALVGTFFAGNVVWTLMEYSLHRTLFHWVPDTSWGERFHFFVHGVHHRWYLDRYRLVMPPAASLSIGVVVLAVLQGLAWAASPIVTAPWVPGFFAGIVFGYLVYDMIHYYVHHAKPTNRVMLALRAHHNKHHHNALYANKKFGVSSTLWDHVFGTYE